MTQCYHILSSHSAREAGGEGGVSEGGRVKSCQATHKDFKTVGHCSRVAQGV